MPAFAYQQVVTMLRFRAGLMQILQLPRKGAASRIIQPKEGIYPLKPNAESPLIIGEGKPISYLGESISNALRAPLACKGNTRAA